MEVLADVLNSPRGALYDLVAEGKALDVGFSFDPLAKASLGYFIMVYPQGSHGQALDRAVRAILRRTARRGVSPALVRAAKRLERSEAEFQKNSIKGLADEWSEAVAVEGLTSPDEDLHRIEKVTVAEVNRAASHYLRLDTAMSAVLRPTGSGKPVASHGFGGPENIAISTSDGVVLPAWARATLGRLAPPQEIERPVVTRLPNGITLVVQPEDVSDTVSVYGEVRNQAKVQVPKGKDGLADVLDGMFSYGTAHLSRKAFQRALDAIGAEETAGVDFSVKSFAGKFGRAVTLLADNELHPAFTARVLAIVKRQVAGDAAGRLESPRYLAKRAIRAALFPAHDPTLRETTPASVEAITLSDLKAYYHAAIRPDLTTIVVIGKVTPKHAKAVIEKHFGQWTAAGPKPDILLPKVPPSPASATAVPRRNPWVDSRRPRFLCTPPRQHGARRRLLRVAAQPRHSQEGGAGL
jgi:zinc protease